MTAGGKRRCVCEGVELRPVELAARAARDAGKIGEGKTAEPIVGGMVYCTWREPSVVMAFRCNPAKLKPAKIEVE